MEPGEARPIQYSFEGASESKQHLATRCAVSAYNTRARSVVFKFRSRTSATNVVAIDSKTPGTKKPTLTPKSDPRTHQADEANACGKHRRGSARVLIRGRV